MSKNAKRNQPKSKTVRQLEVDIPVGGGPVVLPTSFNKNPTSGYQGSGYQGNSKPDNVYIQVVGGALYHLNDCTKRELEKMLENMPVTEEAGNYIFSLKPEDCSWRKIVKTVQCCAYTATKEYLEALMGIKMDYTDKSWYESHPVTNQHGLPMEHTITVLNDLVQPYGVGVSHVYVRKLTSSNEEQKIWKKVLGINPKAEVDIDCNNSEFIEACAPEPGPVRDTFLEQAKGWNFEYSDTYQGAAVVFTNTGVQTFATGGGHATYKAPRANPGNWAIAIQFDRLDNIKYHQQPPVMNYTDTSEYRLDWLSCKYNGKDEIRSFIYNSSGNSSNNSTPAWQSPSSKDDGGPKHQSPSRNTTPCTESNTGSGSKISGSAGHFQKFCEQFNWDINKLKQEDLKVSAAFETEATEICNQIEEALDGLEISAIVTMFPESNPVDDLIRGTSPSDQLKDASKIINDFLKEQGQLKWSVFELYGIFNKLRKSENDLVCAISKHVVRSLK